MDNTIKIANLILAMVAIVGVIMLYSTDTQAEGIIRHNWFASGSIVQSYVQYAYNISDGDMDFITTLEAENWLRNPQRQSEVRKDWVREDSWGFCMMHRAWHSDIVDDARFFTDPYRQLDQCYKKYIWGTTFYWYYHRNWLKSRFSFEWTYMPPEQLTIAESIPSTINTYVSARKAQDISDVSWKKAMEDKRIAEKKWEECKQSGECKD